MEFETIAAAKALEEVSGGGGVFESGKAELPLIANIEEAIIVGEAHAEGLLLRPLCEVAIDMDGALLNLEVGSGLDVWLSQLCLLLDYGGLFLEHGDGRVTETLDTAQVCDLHDGAGSASAADDHHVTLTAVRAHDALKGATKVFLPK